MKIYTWLGIVALATLGGCQSSTEEPKIITEQSEIPVIYEIPVSENVEDYINKEPYEKPKGIEEPMEIIKNVLESNNEEETIEVFFDEETGKVFVTFLSEGMLDIASLAIEQDSFRASWYDLVENYRQLTVSMKQVMEKYDYSTDVVFYVLNDYNPKNCLLAIQNDTVTYDFVSSEK